jgi:DNA-binding beta-propeller fold protein YncE
VTVYAPGSKSVLRTISQGLNDPGALAFDGSGNLYVANITGNAVTVYATEGVFTDGDDFSRSAPARCTVV